MAGVNAVYRIPSRSTGSIGWTEQGIRRSRSFWDHHSRTRRGLQSRLPFNSYVCSCSFRRNILEQDKRAALTDHCRGVYGHSIGMGGNLVGYRISEEGGFFYIF